MDILLKNASVVVQNAAEIRRDKDIRISDNRIKSIKDSSENRISEVDRDSDKIDAIIDCSDKVVIPGLVNAHTHLYQSMLRGFRDDLDLKEWCEKVTFPYANYVTQKHREENDISAGYYWTMLGSIEMIKNGITTCINMDKTLDSIFEAWLKVGLRGVGAIQAANKWIPEELTKDDEEFKREIIGYIDKWHLKDKHNELIQIFMAPSTPFACTPDFLVWTLKEAQKRDLGVQIHVSETKWEVDQAIEDFGVTPLVYLNEFLQDTDISPEKISAIHCVHLSEKEINIVKDKGIKVVYCPKSNMKLGSGIAPISDLWKRNVQVGLATDGPASNDLLDMFEEMRAGVMLQKAAAEDASVLSARDVFSMATKKGAKIARIDAGEIKEGKLADIVIMDLNKTHSAPVNDIIQDIVYCGKEENVETVIINGKIIMKEKEFVTIDKEAEVNEAIKEGEAMNNTIDYSQAMSSEF